MKINMEVYYKGNGKNHMADGIWIDKQFITNFKYNCTISKDDRTGRNYYYIIDEDGDEIEIDK